jgi:hypothetical protein
MARNFALSDLHGSARKQAEDLLIADTLRAVVEKAEKPRRKHKYGAVPTEVDGVYFPSKLEAKRYTELKMSERAGTIAALELQPRFPIVVNGIAIAEYRADFRYRSMPSGDVVIEDSKGVKTPVYRIKKRLVEALYRIKIIEVSK